MGVTGATGTLNAALPQLLDRVHQYSGNIPAVVGFGVSTRDHFLSVARIAEGVAIGSEIINRLADAPPGQGASKIREYCAEISGRKSSQNGLPREVGMVETLNEAKEPNGVEVDQVITDADRAEGPGLVEQIEALNTNGDADPTVRITCTDATSSAADIARRYLHALENSVASTSRNLSWTVSLSSTAASPKRRMTPSSGKNSVHTTPSWDVRVNYILPLD